MQSVSGSDASLDLCNASPRGCAIALKPWQDRRSRRLLKIFKRYHLVKMSRLNVFLAAFPEGKAMPIFNLRYVIFLSFTISAVGSASAGDFVYTPINPSFGGSPLNSSHLLTIAGAQKNATASDYKKPVETSSNGGTGGSKTSSDADLFVRQLQGRLLSALASQVTDAIFGDKPQDSGTVKFGDTTVTFDRTPTSIRLRIENAADGTVTDIVVPQLVTSGSGSTTTASTGSTSTARSSAAATQLSTHTPVLSGSALSPLSIN